jgi:hypothetical protein
VVEVVVAVIPTILDGFPDTFLDALSRFVLAFPSWC